MSGSMNVTFSRRRYVDVFLAVCDGAPSCCSVQELSGIVRGCLVVDLHRQKNK